MSTTKITTRPIKYSRNQFALNNKMQINISNSNEVPSTLNNCNQFSSFEPDYPSNKMNALKIKPRMESRSKGVKLFIRGMRSTSTREVIHSAMSQFGAIDSLKIPFSKTSQKNMGYGYIVYKWKETYLHVLNHIKSVVIEGKEVQIMKYDPTVTQSFKKNHPTVCQEMLTIPQEPSSAELAIQNQVPSSDADFADYLRLYTRDSFLENEAISRKTHQNQPMSPRTPSCAIGSLSDPRRLTESNGMRKPTSIYYTRPEFQLNHIKSNLKFKKGKVSVQYFKF